MPSLVGSEMCIRDRSLAVGLIYLDNYEEALASVEEVRRSLLKALIDRKVNKYISSFDGICQNIEKDKYLVILKKKSVMQMQEQRFELLEDVKTVNIGNELSLIHISEPTRLGMISYAVFCLKKKKTTKLIKTTNYNNNIFEIYT